MNIYRGNRLQKPCNTPSYWQGLVSLNDRDSDQDLPWSH